jgi:Condensation domain
MLKTAADQSRRILLEKYLRGECSRGPSPQIRKVNKGGALVSLSQEQLWLQSQEYAIPGAYTESITVFRNGALDLQVLKQSLREVLRRHELWRSRFEVGNDGRLYQVVGEDAEFPLVVADLSAWPASERDQEAARVGNAQAQKPFDLQSGPLVRGTLVSLSDQQHRLYIDMHQIITDGISVFQILPIELTLLYESFLTGQPAPLPNLTWQFADYAAWQREWLQGATLQEQLEYWRGYFAIQSSPVRWPKDGTRPASDTHRAKIEPFALPWETLDELQTIRKRSGISLFASLVAVFSALFHHYSQQDNIVLGTLAPCGRCRTEFKNLMGYFMNPVPLQLRVAASQTFHQLMLQAQDVISGAICHGDVPFEHVVRALGKQPVPSRRPPFEIAISLAPPVAPIPPGWDMTPMDVESGAGRWDFYLEMSERPEYLLGRAQYNPDIFEQTTIDLLLDDFRHLAKAAGANPDHRLSDLMRSANIR